MRLISCPKFDIILAEERGKMFIGRKSALEELNGLWQKSTPSLVTVRGRRRIGKSTLIAEFAKRTSAHFISIDGQAPGKGVNNKIQLRSFIEQLSAQTNAPDVPVNSWLQALQLLDNVLPNSGRTVVLLDEISWMGGYDVSFPGTLKTMWDKAFKRHDNLIFVLCGSVSSWIADNILNGTGFAGRDSLDIVVDELPLSDCRAFWGNAAERTSASEMLDFLSVSGGVPKYLEELNPSRSAEENIRQMCFTPGGILFRDFDQIFNSIFGKKAVERKAVLQTLATGAKSVSEIAYALGKMRNGHLVDLLDELDLAGFVAKDCGVNPSTGKAARLVRYRLKDNYTRFYLHHIAPHAREIREGLFRYESLASLKGWDAIKGLQFENLVIANYRTLLPILGVEGASLLSAAPFRKAGDGVASGVQIDLLLQTKTTAYVVEVKRKKHIEAEIVCEMTEKIKRLGLRAGVSARTVLVYDGQVAPSVRLDHEIDFLIPAERLFE